MSYPDLDRKGVYIGTKIKAPTLLRTGAAVESEALYVAGSPAVQDFVDTAAESGLGVEEALRMGIERGLVLADLGEVGIDLDKGRRVLREAADLARTEIALTPATASWIRRLCMRKPVPSTPLGTGIVIRLPERLLVRASTEVTSRSLRTGVVAEMIAWEMAAALSGRTMGEWALRELSLRTGRQL